MEAFVPTDLAEVLLKLGDAILPLSDWNSQIFSGISLKDFDALAVFEQLVDLEEPGLEERLKSLEDDALARAADSQSIRGDRASRGWEKPPRFQMDLSNWPTLVDPSTDPNRFPASRRELYRACWTPLRNVVASLNPDPNWPELVDQLKRNEHPEWPKGVLPSSSRFILNLGNDFLIATLGMKGASNFHTRYLLLETIHERRRVGNAYTRQDVDLARAALEAKLREFTRS